MIKSETHHILKWKEIARLVSKYIPNSLGDNELIEILFSTKNFHKLRQILLAKESSFYGFSLIAPQDKILYKEKYPVYFDANLKDGDVTISYIDNEVSYILSLATSLKISEEEAKNIYYNSIKKSSINREYFYDPDSIEMGML